MSNGTQTPDQVKVLGPDNKTYRFPKGTNKEAAVSYFQRKGITSAEPSATPKVTTPKAPKVGAQSSAPPQSVDMQKEHPFYSGIAETSGLDPQKVKDYGGLEVVREQMLGMGKMMTDIIHDPLNVGNIVDAVHKSLRGAESDIWSGITKGDTTKLQHGLGMGVGALSQILGGAEGGERLTKGASVVDNATKAARDIAGKTGASVEEATRVASRSTTAKVPSRILQRKAFGDAYVHARGLDVAQDFKKAADEVHKEVATHAEALDQAIDTAIPSGVIDAGDVATKINQSFGDVVKTPEKVHPTIAMVFKDAATTPPGGWTFAKTRQFRSSIGRAIDNAVGPQQKVLTQAYIDLTKRLGDTATKYKMSDSWKHYNELSSKFERKFGSAVYDLLDPSTTGHKVAGILNKDKAFTSELARNLSKYGLDSKKVMKYVNDSSRIIRDQSGWKGTLFRMAYGTPMGAGTLLAAKAMGGGWMPSVAAGAAVGYLSSYITSLARTLRLSPDIIEHMMKERELPGPMKVGKGEFPVHEGEIMEPHDMGPQMRGGGGGGLGGPQLPLTGAPQLPGMTAAPERRAAAKVVPTERRTVPHRYTEADLPALVKKATPPKAVETPALESARTEVKAKHAAIGEVGREPGKRAGTTKESAIGRATKQRERVAAKRAEKGSTALGGGGKELTGGGAGSEAIRMQENAEAQRRAASPHMDVSSLQIPELEEAIRRYDPEEFEGLQKGRKTGQWSDEEYISYLRYLYLEDLEKR